MSYKRFKLITFDVPNVILKLKKPPGVQYAKTAAIFGINCKIDLLNENFKKNWIQMNKQYPNFGLYSNMTWEEWWRKLIVNVFRESGCDTPETELDIVASQLISAYKTNQCWEYVEGALSLLTFLLHKRITIGVISNFDPRLEEILINMRIRRFFNFILTSYEAGFAKPHEQIFKEAMFQSGYISLRPDQCLHIGRSVMLDYFPAVSNNWKGFLVVNKNLRRFVYEHPTVNPVHVFPNVFDLTTFLMSKDGQRYYVQVGPESNTTRK